MKFSFKDLKRHIMTGIGVMIPLVVGAGLMNALSIIIGGPEVSAAEGTFAWSLNQIGSLGMTLVVPVIAAAIAYSVADKPGIAPALIVGLICTTIKAGFIGGILGGLLVGYFVVFLRNLLKNVPKTMKGLVPILIIPFISTFVCGLAMWWAIGKPIVWFTEWLTGWLTSLQSSGKFIFGFVVAALGGTDFGGPINKTISVFCNGLMIDGFVEAEAVKLLACMVPPMGIIIAYLFAPKKFNAMEKEQVKACLPMGICMITECVIPLAMNDFVRVIGSSMLGCGIAGGLSMLLGCGAQVTHGGWFVIPTFTNPLGYVACMVIGSLVMGITLAIWKRPIKEDHSLDDDYDLTSASGDIGDIKLEKM